VSARLVLDLPNGHGAQKSLFFNGMILSEANLGCLSICLPGELTDESVRSGRSEAPSSKAGRIARSAQSIDKNVL
jgi:hypothetical protein